MILSHARRTAGKRAAWEQVPPSDTHQLSPILCSLNRCAKQRSSLNRTRGPQGYHKPINQRRRSGVYVDQPRMSQGYGGVIVALLALALIG